MQNKEILIIAYKFPPMGWIGTRRWAKFSKYLAKDGYKVHVITIDYPYEDKVNWSEDINHENIIIHRLKYNFPNWILKNQNSLSRLFLYKYKFWLKFIKPRKFPVDMAQGWEKYFIPYSRELIQKHNIKNVIVTGPPNSLHYYSSYLKIENPSINLIQDYRDKWNDSIDYQFGTYLKRFKDKEASSYMEWFSVKYSDKIILVSKDMEESMIKMFGEYRNKFTTIHNGFDMEDYQSLPKLKERKFNVVYIGVLAFGREKAVPLIAAAINQLNDDFINENLKISFYSNLTMESFKADSNFKVIERHFLFNDYVSFKNLPGILNEYTFGLSINAPVNPHAFGTKIFDYMAIGMRIVHISEEGELSNILKNKNQYVSDYNVENLKNLLIEMKNDCLNKVNPTNNYHQFDLKILTNRLEELFV